MAKARTISEIVNEIKEVKLPMESASNITVGEKVTLFVTESDLVCLQNATGKRWRTNSNALAGYRIFDDAKSAEVLSTSDEMWNSGGHKSLQEVVLTGGFGEQSTLICVGTVKRVDRSNPKIGFYYKPRAYRNHMEFEKLRLKALRAPKEVSDDDKARGIQSAKDLWSDAYTTLREAGLNADASDNDIERMPLFMISNK